MRPKDKMKIIMKLMGIKKVVEVWIKLVKKKKLQVKAQKEEMRINL